MTDLAVDLREEASEFAERQLLKRSLEVDETGLYSWETVSQLAQAGYFGLHIPEEYGGSGRGLAGICVVMEEISRIDPSTCGILDACTLGSYAILLGSNSEVKTSSLPRLASGRSMASFALTERLAGSDPASMQTVASLADDGSVILNGTKCFIGNGGPADLYVVFAKVGDRDSSQMLAVLAERGQLGFTLGKRERKMGLRGTETFELQFDDCVIEAGKCLTPTGRGFQLALSVLDFGRVTIGAQGLGIARGALDLALAWSAKRQQFRQSLSDFERTKEVVAELSSEITAVDAMLYQLVAEIDQHSVETAGHMVADFTLRAAAVKVLATELARKAVNHSLQLHGGYGYLKDNRIEMLFRDQRVTEIYEGTSEIQRLVMSRRLVSPSFQRGDFTLISS